MKIAPKDWREFQHYKERNPPWIRLQKKLLDNFEFHCLPVASRALAPMLWLIASDSVDGVIDASAEKLAFRLRMSVSEIVESLKPLIDKGFFLMLQDDSNALAARLQDADSETETETETLQRQRTETEKTPRKRSATPEFELPDWINREHWDAWHSCPKRKKATAEQKQLAVNKLDKWRLAGQDHAGALENAAVGGYQGLFIPDAQKAGKQTFAQQAADVARATVPGRSGRDPVLVEFEQHASRATPIPENIREQIRKLKGSVIQ